MEITVLHTIVLFTLLTSGQVGSAVVSSALTVDRDDVQIRDGSETCISNCSHISSNNNKNLVCSVEECKVLQTSENNSQKSEVEGNMVYFERYFDELEKKYKLALHFKWSPVDNVSMERTKGYLLNVSDGISTYSTCYSISTPMQFHTNAHDLFYNDCFGKVDGTAVKLDSKITVNITTLPLWDGDPDDGKVMFVVEVPDCSREELREFTECIELGGWPTMKSCATDCSTYSEVNGVRHPVSCTLSKSSLDNIAGKEKCEDVNKVNSGTTSPPKHSNKTQEWYKYFDEEGNVKIALNFSWTPRLDSSLVSLHGYYLEITPMKAIFTYYNKCYSVHTNLTIFKHSQTEFFHDCYGRGIDEVEPGVAYHIHLNSLPKGGTEKENFKISVPGCEDRRMQDVTHCMEENKQTLIGTVDEIYCNNRSLKYTYHASRHYGELADVVFCERGNEKICTSAPPLLRMSGLPRSNTLYNISLKSSANISANYTIFMHGSDTSYERAVTYFDFSECLVKEQMDETTVMVILILIFGVLCVVGIVVLVCFMCRRDCWRKFVKYNAQGDRNLTVSANNGQIPIVAIHPGDEQPAVIQPSLIPPSIRVYVIFMADHELHKNVVHNFCAFLKEDLGLDVRLNIWQEEEVAANAILYMDVNLKKADKVIVICSEGTRNCLSKSEYDGDMFTPVVRNICQQTFVGDNPGKFLVGYFDYSSQEDVPEILNEQCNMYYSRFKLMKQFEQLYFRLVGVEQYQDGGIQRIEKIAFDRYYDQSLTKHGKRLKDAIDMMKEFVEASPTWYTDEHGADQPRPNMIPPLTTRPTDGSLVQDRSILDPTPAEASISRLNAAPPPELHNGTSTAAKVPNDNPQPRQTQPRRPPYTSQSTQNAGRYQPLSSMTSASTESSYVVQTDVEELSASPSGLDSAATDNDGERYAYPARHRSGGSDTFHSYHPECFHENDFPTFEDNSIDSRLLQSNETEITRIGLTPSMERLREANGMLAPFLSIAGEEEDDVGASPGHPPKSVVITLAHVEDVDDVEDHIRSINQSDF